MRLVFVGAVESSYLALQTLLDAGANVVHIYTLAPKYAHRHSDYANLFTLGERYGIPVTGVNNINEPEVIAALRELAPDYLLVIGWSQLIKRKLLELPRHGAIGFHPAILPENRGRAALPWAILQGLKRTGATLFFLDDGMDAGDIICQHEFDVAPNETARTLYDKVANAEQAIMREVTPGLMCGRLPRHVQDHTRATYTAKRTARDGLIDWQQSAHEVWTLIRAVSEPYPGAFTFYRGRKVTVWSADFVPTANYVGVPGQLLCPDGEGVLVQCGSGYVRLHTVQEEGHESVPAVDYFTRFHDVLGIDWPTLYEKLHAHMGEWVK